MLSMVHEVPLRQKEAYAPPKVIYGLNIHNGEQSLTQLRESHIQA